MKFCQREQLDPYDADNSILSCFTTKFKEGVAYGTLNSMRAAIALINSQECSKSALLNRYFKGIFRLRSSALKYTKTWDVDVVLKEIETWGPTETLELQDLSLKLVMLLALGSAFRVQSLRLIKLSNIIVLPRGVEIEITDLIKTSRPGAEHRLLSLSSLATQVYA